MEKTKPRKKREALSPKCVRTLELLRSFSAATAEQIQREAFASCSLSFVYRELRKLERAEWIERVQCCLKTNRVAAFVLAPKGWELFDFGEVRPRTGKRRRKIPLLHKLGLVDIRHAFGKFGAVRNYYPRPYYALYEDSERFAHLGADAIVELQRDEGSFFFAIEYFPDFHCPEGIESKIKRYCDDEGLFGVLFIAEYRHIINRLRALEKIHSVLPRSKIFHALLSEVLTTKDEVTFTNRNNAQLTIG